MKTGVKLKYKTKGVSTGVALFVVGLFMLGATILHYIGYDQLAVGSALAGVTLTPTLDTEGLEGDNLKAMKEIEKRFKKINIDTLNKDEIELMVRTAMEKFKDIDVSKLKEFMSEDDKGIRTIVLAQGEMIEKFKKDLAANGGSQDTSYRSQIRAWMETNKDVLERVKRKERGVSLPALNLRAPITMTNGTSLNGSVYLPNPQGVPGIVDLVRTQPTFWERLQKGRTSANPLYWVNKTNKQGNAAFIGEGVLKPLASFELITETSNPKKVAERMKVSTEMLHDLDGLTTYIEQELRFEVNVAANTAVLTGVASATNPKGVTLYASLYTQTAIETIDPNNFDAIRAAIAQLRILNYTQGLVAYVNPLDAANMDLSKTAEGVYVLPPFINPDGTVVSGVPIVEDNNIAAGYLLIGDFSKYKILMHEDFFIEWGWENDDFSKNLVTVVGEMRFHQYVSSNHVGAFIYDTFANIKTAITA